MTGHRMEETAQNLVIRAFGRHNITLHIDDGCMGGGEAITMTDDIKELDWQDEFLDLKWGDGYTINNWRNNDVTYGTNNHFTKERWHIFHYCIFGYKKEGSSANGVSEGPKHGFGDDIFIADAYNDWPSYTSDQAQTLAHELGHNIGLYDLPYTYAEGEVTLDDDTAMGLDTGTADYHWIEWENLKIHYIAEGDGVHLNGPKD